MNQIYHKMQLRDPATASFISMPKDYFGSLLDFQGTIDAMKKTGSYADAVVAFTLFANGNRNAEHSVCYNNAPLFVPADLIGKERFELDETRWNHENTYGRVYQMKADRISADQIMFQCGKLYYRCVRPTFYGLQYKTEKDDTWQDVGNKVLGNECIVDVKDGAHKFRLFVTERCSKDPAKVLSEMWLPDKLDFRNACNEIFGDS